MMLMTIIANNRPLMALINLTGLGTQKTRNMLMVVKEAYGRGHNLLTGWKRFWFKNYHLNSWSN